MGPTSYTVLLCIFFVFHTSDGASKLPKLFKVCKRSDPQVNKCLETAIRDAFLGMIQGLPSLGVPPLDPFRFKELVIDQSKTQGPVRLDLKFIDLDLAGTKKLVVEEVTQNWDGNKIEINFAFPEPITLSGGYKMDGQVLVLPVKGEGKCKIKFDDFKASLIMVGERVKKGEESYLHFNQATMHLDTSKMTVRFDGLFNDNKQLGETTNTFLNDNWEEILNELKPSVSLSLGEAARQVSNLIFDKVPLDVIAPK